jgi:hydroxymethylbilane synthase
MGMTPLRIGARGSKLSLIQARLVECALVAAHPGVKVETTVITTTGDRQLDLPLPLLGGKGVFTEEIEAALIDGRIDFAVHSLKDLPASGRSDLVIGAILPRADVRDALISRHGEPLAALPRGAAIGTSSPRRSAQLLAHRADVRCLSIRGNIETRLRKAAAPDGTYDAIVLARAGLDRLDCATAITETLPLDVMLPAPGQGAIAVQCRPHGEAFKLVRAIDDRTTNLATTAERSFLSGLGGGCSAPIAAFAACDGDMLHLRGRVIAIDGSRAIDVDTRVRCQSERDAAKAGTLLAGEARARGAALLWGHES